MYSQRTRAAGTRHPAYRTLSESLRVEILDGTYRPGDRLPTEFELSARSGLGRSTVREAIRALESQHLVVTTRGVKGGTFVAEPDTHAAADSLGTQLDFLTAAHRLTIGDLIEARVAIELPATESAARRAGAAADALFEVIPERRDANHLEHNWRFHATVLRLGGNPLFELLAAPILRVLEERFDRSRLPSEQWEQTDAAHRLIAGFIRDGDEVSAREAMRAHLASVRTTYVGIEHREEST
jgi:GntR family transcriptional regulator, transcriptional repressor for pyruvate dehydrogenase complex